MLMPRSLRGQALHRLATLTSDTESQSHRSRDFSRLCTVASSNGAGGYNVVDDSDGSTSQQQSHLRQKIDARQFEAILAITSAASSLASLQDAELLCLQIKPLLATSIYGEFSVDPRTHKNVRSPREILAEAVTSALLICAENYALLRERVITWLFEYLGQIRETVSNGLDTNAAILDIADSLHGFLGASAIYLHALSVYERVELHDYLLEILSPNFLVQLYRLSSIEDNSDDVDLASQGLSHVGPSSAFETRTTSFSILSKAMRVSLTCIALEIASAKRLETTSIIDVLWLSKESLKSIQIEESSIALVSRLATSASAILSDTTQRTISHKSLAADFQDLRMYSLMVLVCCQVLDSENGEQDVLLSWIEDIMTDDMAMSNPRLAATVFKSLAILAKLSKPTASTLGRSLPKYIVQGRFNHSALTIAAKSLATILMLISKDAVLTSLYSFGNVLTTRNTGEQGVANLNSLYESAEEYGNHDLSDHLTGSSISLNLSTDEETTSVFVNVVRCVVIVALDVADPKINSLARSMLLQKLGRINRVVDLEIIAAGAALTVHGEESELKGLLKVYAQLDHNAISQKQALVLEMVSHARMKLAEDISWESSLFRSYAEFLLESIVAKGEVQDIEKDGEFDTTQSALELCQLLRPLGRLAQVQSSSTDSPIDPEIIQLQREAWYNLAVHGITIKHPLFQQHKADLQFLALHSPPLAGEDRIERLESDIDLNTILRRGSSPARTAQLRKSLAQILSTDESSLRALSYAKLVFLHATHVLEYLRAEAGNCAEILHYFADPSLRNEPTSSVVLAIAKHTLKTYKVSVERSLVLGGPGAGADSQLSQVLMMCCSRIDRCREMALTYADSLIELMPAALCQRQALFTLLELLNISWLSCFDAESAEYSCRSSYKSGLLNFTLVFGDDVDVRKRTLDSLLSRARIWFSIILNSATVDVKGLLQTYLAEYNDQGAYGHVAVGRSFAVEIGIAIANGAFKLNATSQASNLPVNVASDFIAQYTTRTEYRFADPISTHDEAWLRANGLDADSHNHQSLLSVEDASAADLLAVLNYKLGSKKFVPAGDMRDILRRTASVLCTAKNPHCGLVQRLVEIPFLTFNKTSIQLGISLWVSVIHENPQLQPRILIEIAKQWQQTLVKKIGVFDDKHPYQDPFFLKEEFAPTDRPALESKLHAVNNAIAPHLRILQFLSSHFSANRLRNAHTRRVFVSMISFTLDALVAANGHPLAREFYLSTILFAVDILKHFVGLDTASIWRLKDRVLSAGLSWFAHPPCWSFGSNRITIKTECRMMHEVQKALRTLSESIYPQTPLLSGKTQLLLDLIDSEIDRLQVWLTPLDREAKNHLIPGRHHTMTPNDPTPALLKVAWQQSPRLAISLTQRYRNPLITEQIIGMIKQQPEAVLDIPEALYLLLGDGIRRDASWQLKYLLYWAPVNPISAVNYFTMKFEDDPFVIQYAMRALESHAVDVTFFYVPQIVQALRYDKFGYVQRYIVDTAQVSQFFAHQIIWNMKANAYKDEDSEIEDGIKPTLDKVLDEMLASFTSSDREFYEKEFFFFNEVTSISGKLRPYIKRDKAEKKAKIEEELRKIQVEVGVYLPSNPEGVLVGIDRKSGKPLQSHAKAPFMATFRIRKQRANMEQTEEMLEAEHENTNGDSQSLTAKAGTYEVWQSAIFKVGDDVRQDVLALQMIAAFRGIFDHVGLDVYVYPNRVTATAPGCGVIDVLPNSISRDMLGREAVNGLYEYFRSKYGTEDSIKFQEARSNFVKSMAAYSVISYLLQFKDRHNGNIMIDDAGHILHIDFGFCFDIAPGGVKFERAPFKLTSEMIAVMGGSTKAQGYKWFSELCVKAFLASRPYTDKLCDMISMMLDSGLPCFKPQSIQHFRERMVLEKSEREAAEFMKFLIKKSHDSYSTGVYDQFQLLTNGIPF